MSDWINIWPSISFMSRRSPSLADAAVPPYPIWLLGVLLPTIKKVTSMATSSLQAPRVTADLLKKIRTARGALFGSRKEELRVRGSSVSLRLCIMIVRLILFVRTSTSTSPRLRDGWTSVSQYAQKSASIALSILTSPLPTRVTGSSSSSALFMRIALIANGEHWGHRSFSNAAAPATIGAEKDVPKSLVPLVPDPLRAPSPAVGAAISGLMALFAPGPREEYHSARSSWVYSLFAYPVAATVNEFGLSAVVAIV
mmetsp:Transcript_29369/g.41292  ORF Transcript_29369/g.41292 Transcript_29369/m.41292 type:complete len:255 (+) Transcript_29369:775-1539(+)